MWVMWAEASFIFVSWGTCTMACLKGIFFLRSTHQRSESNSAIISVLCFFFFFCDLIMRLSAGEGRAISPTLSPGAEKRLCKLFLPEQKTYLSSFIDMAAVTIIRFTRRGTHTGWFFFQCRTTPGVFTEGSSLLEVEMLICCFQHKWGTGKDMLFLSSFVCSGISATCHAMSPLLEIPCLSYPHCIQNPESRAAVWL